MLSNAPVKALVLKSPAKRVETLAPGKLPGAAAGKL